MCDADPLLTRARAMLDNHGLNTGERLYRCQDGYTEVHRAEREGRDLVVKVSARNNPHPNKRNTLAAESYLLWLLAREDCQLVPSFVEFIDTPSESNTVCLVEEFVEGGDRMENGRVVDLFRTLAAQYGVVHGDLKPDSVIWDGQRAVLIDFDQAIYAPGVKGMTLPELCAWAEEFPFRLPFGQCGSLRKQLAGFGWSEQA